MKIAEKVEVSDLAISSQLKDQYFCLEMAGSLWSWQYVLPLVRNKV
jgi:hypothetical protein